ncbi:MAG: Mth938-like domain-containing protein [Candidatus Hodarchaeota archaeon]
MQIIESYGFGNIRISSKSFSNDVIIFPEEVLPNWWRKEGHNLHMDDLQEVIKRKPEFLIIGTGYNGVMRVSKNLITQLEEIGIKTSVMKSGDAVKAYNKLVTEKKKVAAGLHLTC